MIEDGTNTPVADARVFVVLDDERAAPDGSPPEALRRDRDGRYQFDTLPPGRYHIAAQKDGFAPPMDPSTMQIFEVAAGQVLDDLTVSLRRGGAFAGRVLDPQGQPIANVGVTALLKRLYRNDQPVGVASSGPPLLMPSGQGQTNDLGEFRIFGLWPGEYVIVATAPIEVRRRPRRSRQQQRRRPPHTFPGPPTSPWPSPWRSSRGETVSDLIIPLVSVPAFKISGVVVDGAGAPVANAMVMLMGGQRGTDLLLSLVVGSPLMSQSDAGGRFTFGDVPAGAYTVRADAGFGGIGAFGFTDTFGIDIDGTPRGDPSRPKPAREPGTIEVTVDNADVGDLRIVVTGSQ